MNLFYEEFPETVRIGDEDIKIITDFREYIRLLDMLKCEELTAMDKHGLLSEYFLSEIPVDSAAIKALGEFITMAAVVTDGRPGRDTAKKDLFSYAVDYPYILSGFLRDYDMDLDTVGYLHWWKFRMLFDGLSEDTEIRQRIMYRGIRLSDIKDKEERKRISRIQKAIGLPDGKLSDFDIGNAFA